MSIDFLVQESYVSSTLRFYFQISHRHQEPILTISKMEELLQKTGMHNDKKNSHIVPTPNPAFQSPPYVNDERAMVRERIDSLDHISVPNWHKYDETEDFRGQKVRNYMPQVEFAGHGSLLDDNDPRYKLGDSEKQYGPYVWIKAEKEDKKGRAGVALRSTSETRRNCATGELDALTGTKGRGGRDKILIFTNLGTLRKGQGCWSRKIHEYWFSNENLPNRRRKMKEKENDIAALADDASAQCFSSSLSRALTVITNTQIACVFELLWSQSNQARRQRIFEYALRPLPFIDILGLFLALSLAFGCLSACVWIGPWSWRVCFYYDGAILTRPMVIWSRTQKADDPESNVLSTFRDGHQEFTG